MHIRLNLLSLVVVVSSGIRIQHFLERLFLSDAVDVVDAPHVDLLWRLYTEEQSLIDSLAVKHRSLVKIVLKDSNRALLRVIQLTQQRNLLMCSLDDETVRTNVGLVREFFAF